MTRKEQTKRTLAAVEKAILEISAGAASYTVSTSDGSKSYTRATLSDLYTFRRALRLELRSYDNAGRPPITMTGVRYV